MAEGFEPFHVPQQSRRDKLRVVAQTHPACDEGCSGLLPLYDPSLLSSDMLICAHPLSGAGTATVEVSKQNPVCAVKSEGGNFMSYVGGFINASSSSSSSHRPFLDPQSSFSCNPFLYTAQNVIDLDHSFNGDEVVSLQPTPSQGLSLSLAPHHPRQHNLPLELNLQQYDFSVFDKKCMGGGGGYGASMSNDLSRVSVPLGPFTGYASVLKASRFLRPAQQILEELCDVGRGVLCERSYAEESSLMDLSMDNLGGVGAEVGVLDDSLACGDPNGSEHRKKKMTLLSILDEVYKRYKMFYQQLHAVVASFESVAGLSNAAPYASYAIKTMSKHFRGLKNAITDQLRYISKTLGEGSYRKDETSRLGTTDRDLHSQRPIHGLSILEHQHVWRPQRGLPERAVAVLRAWLFEHFLHPYPTDTDKQMLAKQTGLSRSQVSNWFINARVRIWKPMVEEIHMLETRQAQKASEAEEQNSDKAVDQPPSSNPLHSKETPETRTTQNNQDPPTKRSRNELPVVLNKIDQPMNFSYHNPSFHHHVGASRTLGNSGVSLTLGLRQNNGIGLSEPFPMNMAHHFGLEANNEGCVVSSFEAPNRHLGKDVGGQLLHDFVG